MLAPPSLLRPSIGFVCRQCRRQISSRSKVFKEGDVVLVKAAKDASHFEGRLTKPLSQDGEVQTHRGPLKHSAIIGRRVRDTISTAKGVGFRLHEPTLSDYAVFTPRIVTPIYPQDTNLIVSLLDIHVSPPTEATADEPPLEILEAGTGHGSLTLHLARAIHAANSARPPLPNPIVRKKGKDSESQEISAAPSQEEPDTYAAETEEAYKKWKETRSAIIHTLDNSKLHSDHARKVVRGFRNGLYFGNVDFHVGELQDFFDQRQQHTTKTASLVSLPVEDNADSIIQPTSDTPPPSTTPFLTHCILDLPGAHEKMDLVSQHMHPNGKLIIFVPSITQIADCVDTVKRLRLPLLMDSVLELGGGMSGGREWDVRTVRVRARERKKAEGVVQEDSGVSDTGGTAGSASDARSDEIPSERLETTASDGNDKDWALVCRPKVGERVIGGGFLGVWSRMRHTKEEV